ncbi:MAG: DUF4254 domain-containing protein [Pirellulales bacterium]
MIDVATLTEFHRVAVEAWHQDGLDRPYEGFLEAVRRQHEYNYLLWHEEDIARSPDVGDARIAEVKRAIDRYNQLRNDWIEKLNDLVLEELDRRAVVPAAEARLNTETPGSAIDRLSILAIRIYHMTEQAERDDATETHRAAARQKLAVLHQQHADLSTALAELLADLFAGRKRLKLYRQFKMYNDPAMNPYLYGKPGSRTAGRGQNAA